MTNKIKNETDEQLVSKIKKKNRDAEIMLLKRYMNFCSVIASQFFKTYKDHGIHHEDLFAVAQEGYVIALKKYNKNKGKFYSYWRRIASNLIMKYIKDNSYFFGGRSFNGISLDSKIDAKDGSFLLADYIGKYDEDTNENLFSDELRKLINSKECNMTYDEKMIFNYFLDGYSVDQIAKLTKFSKPKIYNLKRRAKEKFSSLYKKDFKY